LFDKDFQNWLINLWNCSSTKLELHLTLVMFLSMLLSGHSMYCFFYSWFIFSRVMLSQPCEINFLYSGKFVFLCLFKHLWRQLHCWTTRSVNFTLFGHHYPPSAFMLQKSMEPVRFLRFRMNYSISHWLLTSTPNIMLWLPHRTSWIQQKLSTSRSCFMSLCCHQVF
jgi:hypothetical protein